MDEITGFEVDFKSACDNNGTEPDWTDDFYKIQFKIYHQNVNVGDLIEVTHPSLLETAVIDVIPLSLANGYTHIFDRKMQTAINVTNAVPGWVPFGTFTVTIRQPNGNILDTETFTFNDPDDTDNCHTRPCSVCTANGGAWSGPNPTCWPDEIPTGPCDDPINYAPDPIFPEITPLKYVKVILHIFQVEDPNNPNQPHPTDPQHYSSQHVGLIKSWFDHPDGVNEGFLGNLCPPTADQSPHISDSRIRFLLEYGEEGKDIFFHANNEHWGLSSHNCIKNSVTYDEQYPSLKSMYVTSPSTTHPTSPVTQNYIDWIMEDGQQNAFHVFISRGRWIDLNGDGPDTNIEQGNGPDCFNPAPGGYTFTTESYCNNNPTQYIMGNYDQYLNILNGSSSATIESLGNQITGEFFHVMTLDHVSPFQIHFDHDIGDDGCDDTNPSQFSNNLLGCDFDHPGGRCHLTECQLGRMHLFFEFSQPGFERFPDGNGGWVMQQDLDLCSIALPDIVVPTGADIVWAHPRQIRSNVIVEEGAKLTITCDIGMPAGARITVKTGGHLFVDGARIYNNCSGTYWDGIVVEGLASYGNFYDFQGLCRLSGATIENAHIGVRCQDTGPQTTTNTTFGGIIYAFGSTFLNCQQSCVDIRTYGSPGQYPANGSSNYFRDCHFVVDGLYQGDYQFLRAVYLEDVEGVDFDRCQFSNTYPLSNMGERGDGIYCRGAGVNVGGGSFGTAVSSFNGFRYGIVTSARANAKVIRVTKTLFANNWIGVYLRNADFAFIVDNQFRVGSFLDVPVPIGSDAGNVGLYLSYSSGFHVELNEFVPFTGNGTTNPVGALAFNTGNDYNEIYRNTFTDLYCGNLANRDNRGEGPDKGLMYLCNKNPGDGATANEYDFAVGGQYPAGIAQNQGSAGEAAGNTFSTTPAFNDSNFKNNPSAPVEYFYSAGLEPVNSTLPPDFFKTLILQENSCLSKLPENKTKGELTDAEVFEARSDFDNGNTEGRKAFASDALIRHFLSDSIYHNLDSTRVWLAKSGSLEDHFRIVDTYLSEGNANAAQTALANIPSLFGLPQGDVGYDLFADLKSIQIGAIQASQTDADMVDQNSAALIQIANAGHYKASAQAQDLINDQMGIRYFPLIDLPGSVPQLKQTPPPLIDKKTIKTEGKDFGLAAIPNPTSGLTIFSYQLPAGQENGLITVTDLHGRSVVELIANGNRGSAQWDTKGVVGGTYILNLWADGQKVATKRLVILK